MRYVVIGSGLYKVRERDWNNLLETLANGVALAECLYRWARFVRVVEPITLDTTAEQAREMLNR